jgi:ribosomal protein S3AE
LWKITLSKKRKKGRQGNSGVNKMAQAKRRKKFFDVEMPIIEGKTQLLAYDLEELEGKRIKYDLTKVLRGKSIILNLQVKIEGEKATSFPIGAKLMSYYLRRSVRKGTDYVEDSFSADCANAKLKVKPFLITRRKVSRNVRKAIRFKAREEIINYLKNKKTDVIYSDLLRNKIQKQLSLSLKKIYPLSLCEIRILDVEKFLEEVKKDSKKENLKNKKDSKDIKEKK